MNVKVNKIISYKNNAFRKCFSKISLDETMMSCSLSTNRSWLWR